jgi:hypothetical protein
MLSLRKPSAESLRRFLTEQAMLDFSYSAVGATATMPPPGYVVDRTRIKLGEGEAVFHSAKAALQRWEQFRLGWVEAWSPDTPIFAFGLGSVIVLYGLLLCLHPWLPQAARWPRMWRTCRPSPRPWRGIDKRHRQFRSFGLRRVFELSLGESWSSGPNPHSLVICQATSSVTTTA